MAREIRTIGIISDTHGLLRPEALNALQGSDAIIHAGDVGKSEILDNLKEIALVVAVRGNIDTQRWASTLPETAVLQAGSLTIYVLHNIHQIDLDPVAAGWNVVVSGHSHKPSQQLRDGILYLNPGSAGPRRFHLPITVARLDVTRTPLQADFITIGDPEA